MPTPSTPACCKCGAALQEHWKACPFCGMSLSEATAPPRLAEPVIQSKVVSTYAPPLATTQQFERDQSLVGIGLIALGVLGFLGGCGLLFSGSLTSLGSMDTVVGIFLIGGGATVAAVIAGTVILSQRSGGSGDAASGIVGGLLAGVMTIGVCGLTVLAMFIYALESCLKGCQ